MITKEKELFEGNETIANNIFFMQIKKKIINRLSFFSFFKIIVQTTPSVSAHLKKKIDRIFSHCLP